MSRRVALLFALAACGKRSAEGERSSSELSPSAPQPPPACVADGLAPLAPAADSYNDTCLEAGVCEVACREGSPDACLANAYAVQRKDPTPSASNEWYARACTLGLAVGCTNLAASLWLDGQPTPATQACAKRLFELACAAREPYGCGMFGRVLASEATTPAQQAAARKQLDTACTTFGGATCAMFALHLESGDLGLDDPALVRTLLQRACSTGDQTACGHDKASEVFGGAN